MRSLVSMLLAALAISCSGAKSPTTPTATPAPTPVATPAPTPTAPPAAGPFNGSWEGSYGTSTGARTPLTLRLTQTGSTVSGTGVVTCSGCGPGRVNVAGTASGQIATITMTADGATTPSTTAMTLTLNGPTLSIQWTTSAGALVTGALLPIASGTPVPSPAPAPSPSPNPTPGGSKYDGTYNLFVRWPTGGVNAGSQTIDDFITIRNGVVSGDGGKLTGSVDSFGDLKFTWLCIITPSAIGTYDGHMNASSLPGQNGGVGTYTCSDRSGTSLTNTWQIRQSR